MNTFPATRGLFRQHAAAVGWLQRATDVSAACAVLYVLIMLRDGYVQDQYDPMMLVVALLLPAVYQWARAYDQLRIGGFFVEAQLVFRGWVVTLVVLVMLAFATKTSELFSRQVFATWAVLGYAVQLLLRSLVRAGLQGMRARGWNTRKAVVFGSDPFALRFAELLRRNGWLGIRCAGTVTLPPSPATSPRRLGQIPSLTHDEALAAIQAGEIDYAYIALPVNRTSEVEGIARELMPLHVDVHWVPDLSAFQLINHGVREIEGQPVLCLSDSPLGGGRWVGKWLLDKSLATIFLLIASPVMIAIALGIRLSSPGPVIFRQRRGGLNGQQIVVWKFRTMRQHAEAPGIVTQAKRRDPRITPIGAILRATSLDELPQLFNVLQGRMSLVGPRPHALEHDDFYRSRIDSYLLRHRIKPGITGWAQVNGLRGETSNLERMEMRVRYDLYYINNWSVWFDLKIIALTLARGFVHRNAF